MTAETKASVKARFVSGAFPTEGDFVNLIDSYTDASPVLAAIASGALTLVGLPRVLTPSTVSFLKVTPIGIALLDASAAASARTAIGAGVGSGDGTVKEVKASAGNGLVIAGSPITVSGTIDVGLSGGTLVRVGLTAVQNPYNGPATVSANHGLAGIPTFVELRLVNITTEGNYVTNDIVDLGTSYVQHNGANGNGIQIVKTATAVQLIVGDTPIRLINKSTGAIVTATPANWRLEAIPYRFMS